MKYKIIIPKEEPKTKCYCGHTTYCDCGPKEEPKQETLEEASEKYCEKVWGGYKDDVFKHDDIITDNTLSEISKTDFIAGAKWMQERMYSEEDILDAWELGLKAGRPLTKKKKEELFE